MPTSIQNAWNEAHEPMTVKEAAALLGLSPITLRMQIKRGTLKAEKHGRDYWLQPREVERYRQEHRRGTK